MDAHDYDDVITYIAETGPLQPMQPGAQAAYRFQIYRRSDFGKPPGVEWAVQGLLVRRGISLVYGEPKTGKSLLMQSVACVAAADYESEADRLWCGYPVCKMKILYIAAEGLPGLISRHDCFQEINGVEIDDENFRYLRRPINYFKNDSDWKQAAEDLKAQGFCPDYIITDTLARSVLGGDERSERDMAQVFTRAEAFCQEMKRAGMCFIGHATDGTKYRGSPAIFAMVDGLSEVTRNGLAITWTCKDFKDAEPFEAVTVRCESAEVKTEMGPQMVVQIKTAAAETVGKAASQLDREMALMKAVLLEMGNSVQSGVFRVRLHEETTVRDGEGKVVKGGWSKATYERRLAKFREREPSLSGGWDQGVPLSLGAYPIQPGSLVKELAEAALSLPSKLPHLTPLTGSEGDEATFGGASTSLKAASEAGEAGSSQGSANGKGPTPPADELDAMMRQLG
jgi:hypothetical protein